MNLPRANAGRVVQVPGLVVDLTHERIIVGYLMDGVPHRKPKKTVKLQGKSKHWKATLCEAGLPFKSCRRFMKGPQPCRQADIMLV